MSRKMSKTLLMNVIVLLFLPGITSEPPDVCQPLATVGRPYYISCTGDTSRANVHWALTSPTGAPPTFLNPNNEAADPNQRRVHANITELLPSGHSETQLWFENVTQEDAGTLVQCVLTVNRKPSRHVVVSCRLSLCRGNGSVRCSVNRTRGNHPVYRCAVESGSQTLRCGLRLEERSVNATAYKFDDEFNYGTETVHDGGHVLYCQVEIAHVEPGDYSLSGTVDAGCGEEVNVIHGIVIQASKPTVSLTYDPQTFRFCTPLKLYCEARGFGSLSSFQWFLAGNDVTEKSNANCKTANSCSSNLKLTPSDFGKEVTCLATASQITTSTRIITPLPPRKPPEFRNTSDVHKVVYIRMGEVFNLTCEDVERNHTLKKLNLTCWKNGEIIASTYAVFNRAHLALKGSQTLDRATCSCSAFYENAKCVVLASNVSIHVHTSSTYGGEQSTSISFYSWTSPGREMTIVYITISVISAILLVFTLGLVLLCCARLIRNSKRRNSTVTYPFSTDISRNSSHVYEPISANLTTVREFKHSEDEETRWTEAELLVRPRPGRRVLMDSLGYLLPRPNLPDVVSQHDNLNFLEDSSSATEGYQETCFTSPDSHRRNSDDDSLSLADGCIQLDDSPKLQKSQNLSHGRTQDFDEDDYITPLSLFAISDTTSSRDVICSKRDEDSSCESGHGATFCFRCREHHQLPAVVAVSSVFARGQDTTSRDVNDDDVVVGSGRSRCHDEVLNTDAPGEDTPFPHQFPKQVIGADKPRRCGQRFNRCMSLGHYESTRFGNAWPASNSRRDMHAREYSNWHPSKIRAQFHGFKSYSLPQGDYSCQQQ